MISTTRGAINVTRRARRSRRRCCGRWWPSTPKIGHVNVYLTPSAALHFRKSR
jgi:hypothetical protein